MCDSFVIPRTVACQASLSMGFLRQEYWSGLPFPSPGDLPDSGIKPRSPALQADSLLLHHWGSYRMQQKQFYSTLLGFSQQVYWGHLPFPPPVDPVLSELSTMTCPSWVTLMAWLMPSLKLHKPLCHNKAVIHEADNWLSLPEIGNEERSHLHRL